MLVLDIEYRPQCVAHALQVSEFHSMLGRGERTSTFRVRVRVRLNTRGGARNSRFHTRMACMLVLDIDYRPQCVAHALHVHEFHSMLGRGARTSTFSI